MPAQMTPSALDRGWKNASIIFAGLLLFVGLSSYALVTLTDLSVVASIGLVGAVVAVLSYTAFLVLWLRDRNRRGATLLDCGPHPTKWFFLVLAVVLPLMSLSLISLIMIDASERTAWTFLAPATMLLQGPFFAIMGLGRLQVTELGLWQYWGLLPWAKIDSVNWAPDSTLHIQAKTRFASLSRGALAVPPEHREAIAGFLAQHGVATTA
jgi:FtsH-binding integral membrane protein